MYMRNKPDVKLYRRIAESKGGLLLSKVAPNTYTKLQWQCAKGHKWMALGNNIIRGSWCPHCSVHKKKTIEDMQILARSRDGECLSGKYVNTATKLKWRCAEGHEWMSKPNNIVNGRWCPVCGLKNRKVRNKKLTISLMKSIAKSRGGKCLSKEYVNAKTNLKWRCAEEHEWYATPHSIKNGSSWCGICAGKTEYDIAYMKQFAKKRNGECLSTTYINGHKPLQWRCAEGHEWKASFVNVRKKSWCPVCGHKRGSDKQRGTIDDAAVLAKKRGGEFLSTKYTVANSKYRWRCSVGHEWIATYNKISQGRWCPECAQGRSEKLVKELFERIFGDRFIKSRPEWLVIDSKLHELDGYSKKLKLAFEYQGIQHYEKIEFFTQNMAHEKRKKIDDLKLKICSKNNVLLIQIPYTVKEKNLQKYIVNKAIERGYPKEKINFEQIDIFQLPPYKRSDKKFLDEIAAKQGGKCLSNYMRGVMYHVNWECKNGHKWSATPNNVRRGYWCPYCAGNIKKTIEDMQKLAQNRKGKCLSKEYINNRTKLKWKCEKGHVWETDYYRVQKGIWCPYCRGVRKSITDIQKMAQKQGGKLLSTKYKGINKKHKWKCKKGHVWESTVMNVRNGAWCQICRKEKNNKIHLEKIKIIVHKKGGKCISKKYKGSKTKMLFRCDKGHYWKTNPTNIQKGRWCPECAGNIKKH